MNVSSIALDQTSGSVGQRSSLRQASKDFEQLFQSLQNGNLSAAQQAYASFQQVQAGLAISTSAQTGTVAAASNPVTTDWSALGQALQSGSQSSAQSVLGQLEQDAQAAWQSRLHQQTQNAQSVYALLQSAQGSSVTSASAGSAATSQAAASSGSIQNDLSALSQALQTGDTAGAQKLLAQLEQDLQASNLATGQSVGRHHRHHHDSDGDAGVNGSSASAATAATPAAATSSAGSTTAQVSSSVTSTTA